MGKPLDAVRSASPVSHFGTAGRDGREPRDDQCARKQCHRDTENVTEEQVPIHNPSAETD